jgi:hypothetical protein
MTYAQMLPVALSTAGSYRLSSSTSSRSVGTYRPSPSDFISSFYAVLRRWQSETKFISDPNKITGHPSFKAIVANADKVKDLIVDELKREPSFLVWALDDAFNEKPYPQSAIGNIKQMTEAWILWADRNDHY